MSQGEAIQFWIESAAEDWEVALKLKEAGKYNHALFFVQLTLEKLIKAIHISKNDESPLFVHNLVLLAQKAGMNLDEKQSDELKEITSFNLTARYDSLKREFYKKATLEFADKWFGIGASFREGLLKDLKSHA